MTSIPGASPCPDRATLDRYFAGTMPAEEIRQIVDHLAACSTCRERRETADAQERLLAEIRSLADAGEILLARVRKDAACTASAEWPRIEGFRLICPIGDGGMGTVYEAEQELPTRRVAIKILKRVSGAGPSPLRLETFSREIDALGRLNHPGIATVHAAGTTEAGEPYLAMELVQGPRIDRYSDAQRLTPAQSAALVARICDAVQHAHDQGVLHCDIKPSNILVPDDAQPKLLDFGLARVIAADAPLPPHAGGSGGLGTLAYMSPEAIRGDPARIDARTDVYALAAVLYRLITGRHAAAGDRETAPQIAARIHDGRIPPPSTLNPAVTPAIEHVVMQAMAPDPAGRPPTAAALGAALRAAAAQPNVVTLAHSSGRRRLPLLILAGLAVGGLLIGGGMWISRTGPMSDTPASPDPVQASRPNSDERTPPGGVVLDSRFAGMPKEGQVVQWVWTYIYIVGDPKEAWVRERRFIETNRVRNRRLLGEQLIRAGAVAEAAGDNEAAMTLFTEARETQGRFRFEARIRVARLLSNWKGCEAAADAIAELERTAQAPKGEGTMPVAYAWLVIAGHHKKCGATEQTSKCLKQAGEAQALLSESTPRRWFDALAQSVE